MNPLPLLLLLAPYAGQDPPRPPAAAPAAAAPRFTLAGEPLRAPRLVFDPSGSLVASGERRVGDRAVAVQLRLTFPEWAFPAPGEIGLGGALTVQLDGRVQTGRLTVVACSPKQVELRGRLAAAKDQPEVAFELAGVPERVLAEVLGAPPVPKSDPPRDRPVAEDLVFCALGQTGTGLDGQYRVGQAIAQLAPTGPLDFVLLLGDLFLPRGVASTGDPLWRRCFEDAYPEMQLPVPFHAVPGDRDHQQPVAPMLAYAAGNSRWSMPGGVYDFTLTSHGKKIQFLGIDTGLYLGDTADEAVRKARAEVRSRLEAQEALLKIVFAHTPIYARSELPQQLRSEQLAGMVKIVLEESGVDLFLAGGEHHLELIEPKRGLVQITSGGGGGPEAARSVQCGPDTVFAHTGGGFTWFRFDGQLLEVSFRDTDGKVLFTTRILPR